MNASEIAEILHKHATWARGEASGERVDLRGANLHGADAPRADLHGADLYDADLHGANLYCADLHGANLRDADLRDANLRGADLSYADLHGANMSDANLFGAYLCGANLRGASLCGANLRAANLRGADLRGANLYGANLRGAVGILSLGPIGSRDDTLYVVQHADGLRYKTGCFWGTREEFLAAVERDHASDSHGVAYRLAVQLAEAVLGGKT